jgi:sulfopyruvate decarboxylase alpha subunit
MSLKKRRKPWHWSDDVHRIFRDTGVRQIAYVPDGGLARLIELCQADRDMRSIVLTTEEEGVAQMAGAWLGGQRGVFLTQSGGVGNCINMLSIIQECRIPFLAMVSMRGEWGETIPWQVPMGQGTIAALEAGGVVVQHVEAAERVPETVAAAARLAFDANRAVAVVVSQRITGTGDRG